MAAVWEHWRVAIPPVLSSRDVHLWLLPLGVDEVARRRLTTLLPAAERAALAFVRDERQRRRRSVARAWRRVLLAAYTQVPATELRFASGRSGKPALLGAPPWMRFSAASCGAAALFVVANGIDVGVDVEIEDALPPMQLRAWLTLEARAKRSGRGLAREIAETRAPAGWATTFYSAAAAREKAPVLLGAVACSAPPARIRWLRPLLD